MTSPTRFVLPEPGDLVWCRFPEDSRLKPAPKSRPALVMAVGYHDSGSELPMVRVAPGTSRKTGPGQVLAWEFLIERDDGGPFRASGLSYSTKFNLRNTLELPYTSEFFEPAPQRPFGRTPKLGILHAIYLAALKAVARNLSPQ
ncbi:MAG: hypothetical protein AABY95_11545 [Pseudomonadota bacterium]